MSKTYSTDEINKLLENLKNGKQHPQHMVAGDYGDITLLQAVIKSELSITNKLKMIKQFIELGCKVDQYSSSMTTISLAVGGAGNHDDMKPIINEMLKHHIRGHMSDLDILHSASHSMDIKMFEFIISHKKIDINTTRLGGSHILHRLATSDVYKNDITLLFKKRPEVLPNPIDRKGYSPLAIAINSLNSECVTALVKNENSKIMGTLLNPKLIVDWCAVNRYNGNFWQDYPEMVEYACKTGKENILPKEITDIFIF